MGHLIHDGSVGARAEQMQGLSSHSAMCRLIPAMEPRISRGKADKRSTIISSCDFMAVIICNTMCRLQLFRADGCTVLYVIIAVIQYRKCTVRVLYGTVYMKSHRIHSLPAFRPQSLSVKGRVQRDGTWLKSILEPSKLINYNTEYLIP
jgi:hypothetical protein